MVMLAMALRPVRSSHARLSIDCVAIKQVVAIAGEASCSTVMFRSLSRGGGEPRTRLVARNTGEFRHTGVTSVNPWTAVYCRRRHAGGASAKPQ